MTRTAFRRMAAGTALLAALTVAGGQRPATAETSLPADFIAASQAFDEAWARAPLSFAAATFAQARATGYGQYEPRADANFVAGEPIHVYTEPVGYAYGRSGEYNTVDLTADFELRNSSGLVLAAGEDFATLSLKSRNMNREFQASLDYTFAGLPPGDYTLVTRINDANSDKSGEFSLPFTIVAP